MNASEATLNGLRAGTPTPLAFPGESTHPADTFGEGECWWVCGSGGVCLKYAAAIVVDGSSGATVYDATGTTTTLPNSGEPKIAPRTVYDDWNRLTDAENSSGVVEKPEYDGKRRQIRSSRDPIAADQNLYRYCGDNPVIYVDPTGLKLYAIDGTTNTPASNTNVWKLFGIYTQQGGAGAYWSGPASLDPGKAEQQSKAIAAGVYSQITKDYCEALHNGENFVIDLVGFSRGAIIAAMVAKYLNDYGCDCGHWTTRQRQATSYDCSAGWVTRSWNEQVWVPDIHKPVPVHWIGLFDPVTAMLGGWPTEFSPNVQSSSVAIRNPWQPGLHPQGGFKSIDPSGSHPGTEFQFPNGAPPLHTDIGSNPGTLQWMIGGATVAGVFPPPLKDDGGWRAVK
jgi:hypothetical protein